MNGKFLRRMEPYNYFGESSLFHKTIRTATITAETEVNIALQ